MDPFLLLPLFALYQRSARPTALEHEGRRALYEACQAAGRPATAGELGRRAGLARKTAEYHLVYMTRLGIVREHAPADAPRQYALPVVPGPPDAPPLDERILALLRARPGLTASEVAAALGITRTRAERRLKRLALDGATSVGVVGGLRRYGPARA